MSTQDEDELIEKLADILEGHYWNQLEEDGKAAAKKSATMRNLLKLITVYAFP